MIKSYDEVDYKDVVETIKKIDFETKEELSKEKVNNEKITKLMYEQMLKGLYLQQNPNMIK